MATLLFALTVAGQPESGVVTIVAEDGAPPIEDILRSADVIVVGQLRSSSEWLEDGIECGRGVIEVKDVIWGAAASGDTLVLEWRQYETPRPRRDYQELVERDWIWLLSATTPGEVQAVSTRCTYLATPHSTEWLKGKLATAPAIVQCSSCRYVEGDTVRVTLGYRNFSEQAREFPGIAFADSILYVDPQVSLMFLNAPCFVINPRPGHLVMTDTLPPMHVDSMSEAGVTFDLRAVFPMRGRSFLLKMDVQGHGMAMTRGLHVWPADRGALPPN